jgi:uncharacterized protein YifE (UPF0438 family)
VPLPNDLTTGSPLGDPKPIQTLVRNAFRRNRRETSHRLVCSALKNGYRFLTLLSRAAESPDSPERASVVEFVRKNNERVLQIKARNAALEEERKKTATAPIEGRQTIIKRVTPEGVHPPVYAPAVPPRPLESFPSGVRKPPVLAATAAGVPFLRFKKPQPRFLERVLRQKSERRAKRIADMKELMDDGIVDAKYEDVWEREVAKLLAEKGETVKPEPTFAKSLWEVISYLGDVSNKEQQDLVARGKAMWEYVKMERELALKEEKERLVKMGRGDEEPKLRVWSKVLRPKKRKVKQEKTRKEAEEEK